ncbi:MAG: SDR family oxidoreductase [Alphaproteobacteria bacterium]
MVSKLFSSAGLLLTLFFFSNDCFSKSAPNNRVLITAVTGAFGTAISKQLASEGYNLVLAGRNPVKLQALKTTLQQQFPSIEIDSVFIDFSKDHAAKIPSTGKAYAKPLTGIVLIGPRPFIAKQGNPATSEWVRVFEETFTAPLAVINAFQHNLVEEGSVVVISGNSSINYLPSYRNTNNYRMLWVSEVKNLAQSFGARKIRVNAISPGIIMTQHHIDRLHAKAARNNASFKQQVTDDASDIPLGRFGQVEDVAHLCSFLLSSKSKHINAVNIPLDGGENRAY